MNKNEILGMVDHTLLKTTATWGEFKAICVSCTHRFDEFFCTIIKFTHHNKRLFRPSHSKWLQGL